MEHRHVCSGREVSQKDPFRQQERMVRVEILVVEVNKEINDIDAGQVQ